MRRWCCAGILAAITLFGTWGVTAQDTSTPTPLSIVVTVIVVPASATPTFTPTETPFPTDTPPPSATPTPSDTPTPSATPTPTPQRVSSVNVATDGDGGSVEARIIYTVSAGEFVIALVLFAIFGTITIQWVLKMLRREP